MNHTGEMTIMNINSRRREQNLTNDADRSCESHHSLSRTRRVKRCCITLESWIRPPRARGPVLQRHADEGHRWIGTYRKERDVRLVTKDTCRRSGKRMFQCAGGGASPVHKPDSMKRNCRLRRPWGSHGPVPWTARASGKSSDFPGLNGNPLPVVRS